MSTGTMICVLFLNFWSGKGGGDVRLEMDFPSTVRLSHDP
jgi:hypothetical protein